MRGTFQGAVLGARAAIHTLVGEVGCCRFEPTCSVYSREAFGRFGITKAFWLSARRLWRCRPGGGSGWDPVPR
ncbi:membrane protein insertion efficiency factor YidD [bacterium]|nr:membrane protein insertion efficiency factor YidD [bacterium]